MRRKICVVVASRTNYGRVKSVLQAIQTHPKLELQLIVGASTLLYRFGNAVDIIILSLLENGVIKEPILIQIVIPKR